MGAKLPLSCLAICVAPSACYDTTSLRVIVQTPPTALDCTQVADRVFTAERFERVSAVTGPDLFYTPRTMPTAQIGLRWGIGIWFKGKGQRETVAAATSSWKPWVPSRDAVCSVPTPPNAARSSIRR